MDKQTDAACQKNEREFALAMITKNMNEEANEQFSNLLISLIMKLSPEDAVRVELGQILEFIFKRSNAYQFAFELFASRFLIQPGETTVSGIDVAGWLSQIKAARLDEPPLCTIQHDATPRRESLTEEALERFKNLLSENADQLPRQVKLDLLDLLAKSI